MDNIPFQTAIERLGWAGVGGVVVGGSIRAAMWAFVLEVKAHVLEVEAVDDDRLTC